jgi:hypothetical protein
VRIQNGFEVVIHHHLDVTGITHEVSRVIEVDHLLNGRLRAILRGNSRELGFIGK